MAKYECKICGYVFDEQQAGETFDNLYSCPICDADKSAFNLIEADEPAAEDTDDDDDFVFEEADETEEAAEPETSEEKPNPVYESLFTTVSEFSSSDSMFSKTEEPKEETTEESNEEKNDESDGLTGSFADFLKERENEGHKDFIDEILEQNAMEEAAAKEEKEAEESPVSESSSSDSGFVIEKRQEFWKKDDEVKEEEKEEPKEEKTSFTFSHMGSVERVIGSGDDNEEKKEEAIAARKEYEDNGLIQTFYSGKPVKTEEEMKAEEEKNKENSEFKPLWGNGMGTVQKVVGAKDPEAEEEDPDVPIEDDTEELVFEEGPTESINDAEEDSFFEEERPASEDITEEVKEESFFEESPAAEETSEFAFEEAPAEEVAEAVEETAEAAEEIAEEAVEEVPAEAEETSEFVFEETPAETAEVAEEAVEEVAEETAPEETVEEIIEETVAEEAPAAVEKAAEETVVEEVVEEAEAAEPKMSRDEIFAAVFGYDNNAPVVTVEEEPEAVEEAPEEVAEEPANDFFEEAAVEEAAEEVPAEEAKAETIFDENGQIENEDEGVVFLNFDDLEEAPAEAEEAPAEEAVEAPVEETAETEEDFFTEPASESEEAPAENYEAPVEEPVETPLEEAQDETVEDTEEQRGYICLDDTEETDGKPVAYSMLKSDTKYTVLYDTEAQKIFDDYRLVDPNVSNGLENIILLPAQCNPLPLKRNAAVETKTVIGALTSCPVEVLQPFCFSKLFIWGEHIPNNSKPEKYSNQALVLVKGEEGHIPNLSSKEELREEVEIAKARFNGTPVGIDLVAGRIEDDLEACVYAKLDFVILNDVSSRILPYALRRARNYLNRVNSKLEILVCVEALKDAQELAKILALGANFVLVERGFDIEMADSMTEALKEICRSTGHNNVHDLNLNDICTIDTDLAMYTDISHV